MLDKEGIYTSLLRFIKTTHSCFQFVQRLIMSEGFSVLTVAIIHERQRKCSKKIARNLRKPLYACRVRGSRPLGMVCQSGRGSELRDSGDVKISGSKRRSGPGASLR